MILNSEFVSRIVNGIKALTKDSHVSKRYILNIGRNKARFLIAQKLGELSLTRESSIISSVNCVKMVPITIKECPIVEFKLCKNLMRSEKKIENLITSKNFSGITSVVNLDGTVVYSEVTPSQYRRNKIRKINNKKNRNYFYIKDGYIYLPDSENEMIDIELININGEEITDVSSCSECDCTSVWDRNFIIPDRMLDLVIKDTIQEVATIYRSSIEDENPNLDSNIKSQTIK